MNKNAREYLDNIEKAERRKTIGGVFYGIFLILSISFFTMYTYDPYTITDDKYNAVIIGVYKPDSDVKYKNTRCSVRLATGETVQISAARMKSIKISLGIIVQKVVSKYFKKKRYRFVSHIE